MSHVPVARLNHAVLYVRDAQAAAEFYGRVFGFEVVSSEFGGQAVFMRAASGENHHDLGLFSVGAGAPRPPRGSTGLYHFAIRYPTRRALADALQRLLRARVPLGGASDHGVSEALYLSDPDGNGLELYWDRPREQWPHEPDGTLAIVTLPLDLDSLLAELDSRQ